VCPDPSGLVSAYRTYGYTLDEIAAHLGVHRSMVRRALRRLEQAADAVG